jgi:hypothetical protein
MLMASWGCIWSPCMRPLEVSTALYYNWLQFTDRAFIWADKLFRTLLSEGPSSYLSTALTLFGNNQAIWTLES